MTAFRIVGVLVCALAAPAYAQVENQDYRVLAPPQAQTTQGKVEVLEFFSYACPHCYELQPHVAKWLAQLPADAVFVRVPVSFGRREWGQLSRAYYALEATGNLARLDDALFAAIHQEKRPLFDEEKIVAWVAEHGGDAAKFRAAFESAAVSAKALRAEQMSRDYKISGVPHLSVGGKYSVLGKTHEEMLKNARLLVDKSAAERKTANR